MKNAIIAAIELNDVVTSSIKEIAGNLTIIDNNQDVTWLLIGGVQTLGVCGNGNILGYEGETQSEEWCQQNHELVTVLRAAAKI